MVNKKQSKALRHELLPKLRSLVEELDVEYKMSDDLLLCFLRVRKCDVDRAFKSIKNYIYMVENYPNLFKNLWPESVQHLVHLPHHFVSPIREQHGRRVLVLSIGDWDYRACSLDDGYRGIVMCLQRVVAEVENQEKGVVLILDFKNFSIFQVRQLTPSFGKKLTDLVQGMFPIRIMGIHVVNEPFVFKILMAMFWPFVSEKIRSRVFFHGESFDVLHQLISPACLPTEFGGSLGPMIESMSFLKSFPEENYSKIFDCFN